MDKHQTQLLILLITTIPSQEKGWCKVRMSCPKTNTKLKCNLIMHRKSQILFVVQKHAMFGIFTFQWLQNHKTHDKTQVNKNTAVKKEQTKVC